MPVLLRQKDTLLVRLSIRADYELLTEMIVVDQAEQLLSLQLQLLNEVLTP